MCSGRHTCEVKVTDIRSVAQPCKRDYTAYLEASYTCVKGGLNITFAKIISENIVSYYWRYKRLAVTHSPANTDAVTAICKITVKG